MLSFLGSAASLHLLWQKLMNPKGEDDDDELERLRKRCEDDLALLKKDKIRVTLADLVSADEQADNAPPPLVQRHQG